MSQFKIQIVTAVVCLLSTGAMAQTKVQCQIDANGYVSAALIWQNTLGIEKANSICRSHSVNRTGEPVAQASPPAERQSVDVGTAVTGARHRMHDVPAHRGLGHDRPGRANEDQLRGRFDPEMYERAARVTVVEPVQRPEFYESLDNRGAQGHASKKAAMEAGQPPAMGDYVPLEMSDRLVKSPEGFVPIF